MVAHKTASPREHARGDSVVATAISSSLRTSDVRQVTANRFNRVVQDLLGVLRVVNAQARAARHDEVVVERAGSGGDNRRTTWDGRLGQGLVQCEILALQIVRAELGRSVARQQVLVVQRLAQGLELYLHPALAAVHVKVGRFLVAADTCRKLRVEGVITNAAVLRDWWHVALHAALLEVLVRGVAVGLARVVVTACTRVNIGVRTFMWTPGRAGDADAGRGSRNVVCHVLA